MNADGSGAADVAAWRQRQDVEAAAAACAQPGAADVALDAALDAALDSVAGRGAGDGGSEECARRPAAAHPCAAVVIVLTWPNVHRRDWDAADDYQDSDDRSSSPEAACGSGRDGPPPSFSRIDLALPPVQLTRRFPRFPGTAAALEVNLRAGAAWHLVACMRRFWHATACGELCWHLTGIPGAQARRSTSQPAGSMRSPASASAPRRTWR